MRGFSKVIIAGNLTRDPELRTTTSGRSVCSFGVAVNRTRRDAGGNQREEVTFFNCSAWGMTGETINKYAHKGDGIIVSGRLSQRDWEDRNGQRRSSIEIDVDDFNFVGGRSSDAGSAGSYGSYGSANTGSSYSAPSGDSAPAAGGADAVPDDIPEGEISLDDVPF